MKKLLLFLLLLSTSLLANTHYPPDHRSQLPRELNQTYLGFGIDYTHIPYSNRYLMNGVQATSFTNPTVGLNIFMGHFFNPYLAGQISLMRPIKWAYANHVSLDNKRHSIWISIFGLTLRPTLPLSDRFSIYGLGGLGIISRHGFIVNNVTAIPSTDIMTFLTGGGLTYAITPAWHLNAGIEYALGRSSEHQPGVLYAYGGFYYLFHTLHLPAYYTTQYHFYKNFIQAGAFSTSVWNPNINKYFTVGYLPIFWTGDVKTRAGEWLMYERNIFHTHKIFSLDLGVSAATYESKINHTNFQAYSVFPVFHIWFMHSRLTDLYFTYTVAGPAYISQRVIDHLDTGGHFSFQDLIGIGAFLGKNKHFNIKATIGHYSNGNLLPNNPGIEVPLVMSMGYAF